MMKQSASRSVHLALVTAAVLLVGVASQAQEGQPLEWMQGPVTAPIGSDLAEIELSESFVFLDDEGTQRLMELTQNPLSGAEMATIAPAAEGEAWFVVFEWDDSGYVADDEKDELDADAILASIREGTEAGNEARRERGWPTMTIVGWHEAPSYDDESHNLSWAVIGESEGMQTINRITKLLGRSGVMTATLVASPDELDAAVAQVDGLLGAYRFRPGSTYAEYVPGKDKLAQYGLTALVVGGAGAALVKSGLLAKLWKPIAAVLIALGAGLKKLFGSGRSSDHGMDQPIG